MNDTMTADTPARAADRTTAHAFVRALRPRQWLKNVLVFAAPFTAGRVFEPDIWLESFVALVCFCLVSSAVYLVNDLRDVEEDRRHPTKRFRPIALGTFPIRLALPAALALGAAGLALAFVTGVWLPVVLVVYLALQAGYSLGLKHEPVIDLAIVASGFLLRTIAGGVASDLPLSQWFLLVASFGSFFMVAGKRYSEIHTVGAAGGTRRSLERYSESYLRFIWSLAAAVTITFYSLWAFQTAEQVHGVWPTISIAPFTIGLLRYAVDIDRGTAGTPEDIALGDRLLQTVALAWVILLGLSAFTR